VKSEQDPIGYIDGMYGGYMVFTPINPSAVYLNGTPLYTTPPQKEWVGLTDVNEMVEAELTHYWNGEYELTTGARNHLTDFAKAIEAKLKEKNT
jgi:hypothetical protein